MDLTLVYTRKPAKWGWCVEMAEWVKAGSVDELKSLFAVPPIPPVE